MSFQVTIFDATDFEEPTVKNIIGRGSFGVVHKLKRVKDNIYYAVKIMVGDSNLDIQDKLSSEINVISKLSYPCLLKFHGITLNFPFLYYYRLYSESFSTIFY